MSREGRENGGKVPYYGLYQGYTWVYLGTDSYIWYKWVYLRNSSYTPILYTPTLWAISGLYMGYTLAIHYENILEMMV